MSDDLERMGDLALHVAKVARLRHPRPAIPVELISTILEMGYVAQQIVTRAGEVIASRNVAGALDLESNDDEMDQLHAKVFRLLLDPSWPHGVETAVDVALLSRYYERFADHAVSAARRVVFLVTGARPESGTRREGLSLSSWSASAPRPAAAPAFGGSPRHVRRSATTAAAVVTLINPRRIIVDRDSAALGADEETPSGRRP